MTQLDRKLILFVFVGALILLGFRYLPVSNSALTAEIHLHGKLVREITISKADHGIIRIPIQHGFARLQLEDGAARLLEMPESLCPRKICSHTGWIHRPGESIICVPNKLIIRLRPKQSTGIDAITR